MTGTTAARRWAEQLAAWAIDPAILAAAPESPYGFPAALWSADRAVGGPARTIQAVREGLPVGGSVLDVGCGGGAASIPLADAAGRLVGVDQSEDMLASYEAAAARHRVPSVATVLGTWPDVAPLVETADVVVAANVAYNVADLVPFVLAAHERARSPRRVRAHRRAPAGRHRAAVAALPRPATARPGRASPTSSWCWPSSASSR